jgi:hypothetical protein
MLIDSLNTDGSDADIIDTSFEILQSTSVTQKYNVSKGNRKNFTSALFQITSSF